MLASEFPDFTKDDKPNRDEIIKFILGQSEAILTTVRFYTIFLLLSYLCFFLFAACALCPGEFPSIDYVIIDMVQYRLRVVRASPTIAWTRRGRGKCADGFMASRRGFYEILDL